MIKETFSHVHFHQNHIIVSGNPSSIGIDRIRFCGSVSPPAGCRGTVPPGIRIALHAETLGPVRAYHNQAPAGKEETHKRELPCGFPYLFPHPLSMREHKGTPPSKSRLCGSRAPHHILAACDRKPKVSAVRCRRPKPADPGKTGKSRAKSRGNRFPKNKILSDTPLL